MSKTLDIENTLAALTLREKIALLTGNVSFYARSYILLASTSALFRDGGILYPLTESGSPRYDLVMVCMTL